MTQTERNTATHVVIWRGAGSEQSWRRSVMMDAAHACQVQRDLIRMGYRAYVIDEDDDATPSPVGRAQ